MSPAAVQQMRVHNRHRKLSSNADQPLRASAAPTASDETSVSLAAWTADEPADGPAKASRPNNTDRADIDSNPDEKSSTPRLQPPAPQTGNDNAGKTDPSDAAQPGTESAPLPDLDSPLYNDVNQPAGPDALSLGMVHESILTSYPMIQAAIQERYIAYGSLVESRGAFDTKIKGEAVEEAIGFYRNYRHMIGIEHPLDNGGDVFAGYRIGRGQFEPWYQERVTDDGGEFKVGFDLPLWQNDDIDERRSNFYQADIRRAAVEPEIRTQLIDFLRAGSFVYWEWVAAGQKVRIARDLLKNAEVRQNGLAERVKEGDLGEIALVDNNRLLASRQAKLVDAQRKFRQTAVKLSLFLRDAGGQPMIPGDDYLPAFPVALSDAPEVIDRDVVLAWQNRPELLALSLKRDELNVQLAQAVNLQQPELNWFTVASQDVGEPSSKKRDKHRAEVDTGLRFSVPLQRRKAKGKQAQVEGKLAQLNAKEQFTRDKIAAEVQAFALALKAAAEIIEQSRRGLELSRQMEQAERDKFDEGDSDLLLVNLREKATADAAAELVEARLNYFLAEIEYQAALGLLGPVAPLEP